MIIVGLFLTIIPLLIMAKCNNLNTKKSTIILLDIFLLIISFLYILFSLFLKTEPFNYDITSAGDCLIASAVIFVFSPFLWFVLYYYCKRLFKNIRTYKNAKIKSNKDYIYYRDDLDKISPSIVMFTSIMDVDVRKSVSAIILKLKLTGHLQEVNSELQCTTKSDDKLFSTEKFVLNSVKNKVFDEYLYIKLVKKEALNYKYVKKNNGRKFIKLLKILITICIPILLLYFSIKFDDYIFRNYPISVFNDINYLEIKDEKEIENLYNNEIKNKDDYYHKTAKVGDETKIFYSCYLIRADKYEYSIVRTKAILDIIVTLFILLSIISIFVSIFMIIEQIKYFNKDYIRTTKGNELLYKAYALKNYLKDFSLIKDKTQEELVLWEYYLVYAIILDVNIKITDKVIEDYLKLIY